MDKLLRGFVQVERSIQVMAIVAVIAFVGYLGWAKVQNCQLKFAPGASPTLQK